MMRSDPDCTLCKLHKTAEFVCLLGQGPEPCDIMIIGEAPGKREDDSGRPFVGKSGKLLERYLGEIGLSRHEVYISNAVHCRPPDNRTPSKKEISTCFTWLKYEIDHVKPKFILTLGNVPLIALTGEGGIRKKRGKAFDWNGIVVLPTVHPASILYDPTNEFYFEKDLNRFREIIEFGGIPYERDIDYKVVDSWARVNEMIEDLVGTVSSDTETDQLYPWAPGAHIVTVGFGTARHQWIIPVQADAWRSPWDREELIEIFERVSDALEDCYLVGHNWKYDRVWLRVHFGVDWPAEFDTMLAHYAVDENKRHALDEVSKVECNAPEWDVDLELKQGKKGKFEDHCLYLAQDLYYTRELRFKLAKYLNKDDEVKRVFEQILMPCSDLFSEVEWRGVYIDKTKFRDAEKFLRDEVANAERELKTYGDIDWGSPKQVANHLYGTLKIKCPQKTKKGANSASESALNQIDHPCVGALLKFRGARQQLSFFIEGWEPYLVNGRIHPSFKLHGTVTGRLSCEHPNLQQVPRDPRIRTLITAPAGYTLIEADLSQIELRIAAELSGDREMTKAFLTGVDVHWLTLLRELERSGGQSKIVLETAEKHLGHSVRYREAIDILLKMGPDTATEIFAEWKELRKKAKAINFGYLYGMWWRKFKIYARDNYGVIVTDLEAQGSRKSFFSLYRDLPEWHDRQRDMAHEQGYVVSLSGRKRRLPDAMLPDRMDKRRQEAERQAINSPVQSFANELNLMAALQLRKEFPRPILYIIGTVHDSILIEVKNEWVPIVYERLLQIMSHPDMLDVFGIELSIPIEAEAKCGPWAAGVNLAKWKAANSNVPFVTKDSKSYHSLQKRAA